MGRELWGFLGFERLDMRNCWGFLQKKIAEMGLGWNPHLRSEMWGTRTRHYKLVAAVLVRTH